MSETIDTIRNLVAAGDLVRAKAMGEQQCKKSENADLLFLMSVVTARLGDMDVAVKYAQKSIKADNSVADVHFFLATVFRAKNEMDSAIQHARRGLQLNPGSAEGFNKLGVFLSIQNKNEEAENAFRSAIKIDPDHVHANYNLGDLLQQKSELDGAERFFARAVQVDPNLAEACNGLGSVLLKLGKLDEALEPLDRAISINPNYAEAYTNKGQVLDLLGKHDKALTCLRQAVTIEPDSISGRRALATALLESGGSESREAIAEYRKILDLEPGNIVGLIGLAHAYLFLGQEHRCADYAQQILDQHPDNEVAMAGAASIYDRLSRFEDAYTCLQPLIEKGITEVSVALLFASICRHVSQCDNAIEQITHILSNKMLVTNDRRQLYFAVAQLYDRRGDYDEAFKYYDKANKLKFCTFDPEDGPKKVDSLLEVYTDKFLKRSAHSDNTSEKMIFIVGMPRSGTSLLEQVLDSHSQVFGAGELVYLNKTLKELHESRTSGRGYPYCMQDISVGTLSAMADKYLAGLPDGAKQSVRVTDKLPNNYLHLGVIELLFPNARVIHCMRDPLDTCLSCYFQDFSGQLNFSYNLEHLGQYYRQYMRLMEHWKRVLNLPLIEIQYEDMVTDTEQSVRSILEFCGLPWEDGCLDFHKSTRIVKTASYDQVRRPIYKGSIGRWKNYSKHISPLRKALGLE